VQSTQYVPFGKIGWLMPDVEIIAFCRKNHIGQITYTVKECRFFYVTPGGIYRISWAL